MARGTPAKESAERISPNGYTYVKCGNDWRLKHHIVAEQVLGRPIAEGERVTFKDGDRGNFSPDNIVVSLRRVQSIRKQIAQLDVKIRELQARREELYKELANR